MGSESARTWVFAGSVVQMKMPMLNRGGEEITKTFVVTDTISLVGHRTVREKKDLTTKK